MAADAWHDGVHARLRPDGTRMVLAQQQALVHLSARLILIPRPHCTNIDKQLYELQCSLL